MFSLNQIMHIIFASVPLILLLVSLILLKSMKKVATHNNKLYPPSPPKLPFLGHLHLVGSLPHRSLRKLSKKYGPVMLLKLGSVPTVVISSAATAKELFKVHDLASCSRPPSTAGEKFSYNYLDIGLAPYGDYWREVRKICVLELFSARRVQSFQPIREEEISLLLKSISESSCSLTLVNLNEKLYSLTANIISRIAFSKSFRGGELDNENFLRLIRRVVAAVGGFSAVDFLPGVGWMIDRISGAHGRLEKSFEEFDTFFQHLIEDRIKYGQNTSSNDEDQENILDVLLKLERGGSEFDAVKLNQDCIKALLMDIFLAGIETGANTLVWAMTELVKNPKVMKKLQNEIRSCIKEERVKETDLEKLPYLKMAIKEVLRLHTPVPLLLPRETMSHFKLDGYDIDPKSQLYVNVWAIGRDPELWKNPEEFSPDRFAESNVDYKGQNFELLPFGSGRRICPGMNMATATVEQTLANMLLCFDWKLPNGIKEEDVDIEEEAGIAVSKKSPLQLAPVPYFSSK